MTKNEKKRIILSQAQRESMAAQSAQKIQAFCSELAQVQSRRFDISNLIISAQVQFAGVDSVDTAKVRALAQKLVDEDSTQKWSDLRALFAEMGVEGPQPHLKWAAKQVGVTLFPEASLILAPDVETSEGKVIQ